MTNARAFREAVVSRLRHLIDRQGKSVAAVEKEMGRGRGYLGDALRGEKRLSLEVLLEVLEHLGIEPEGFFAARTPETSRRDSGRGARGATYLADRRATAGLLRKLDKRARVSEDPLLQDTSALLGLLTRTLEAHGLVSAEEIEQALSRNKEKTDP